MATLSHSESRRLYSWWWDSHISPKNSKWLRENLTDIDTKVKSMIKLIEEDADSFARRAEMYYKKRPELMKLVEEFYRAYRALAERYDHAMGELRHAHKTMPEAFPNSEHDILIDDSPYCSSGPDAESHTPGQEVAHPEVKNQNYSESEHSGTAESEVQNLREALAKIQSDKDALFLQYQKSVEKLSKTERDLNKAQQDAGGLDERASKAEIEVKILKEALAQLKDEKEAGHVQYNQCLESVARLENTLYLTLLEAKGFDERAAKAETESKSLKQELTRLEAQKDAGLLQYKKCLEKIQVLEANVTVAEENSRILNEQIIKAELEVQALRKNVAELNEEKESLAAHYHQCLEKISKLEDEILRARENTEQLKIEIVKRAEKLDSAEKHCGVLEKSNQYLQLEAENLVQKIAAKDQALLEKRTEIERLQTLMHEEHSHFLQIESALQTLQKSYSQSQQEQRTLALELKYGVQMLKDLELSKQGFKKEVQEILEENKTLHELRFSSTRSLIEQQMEISKLKEIKRKLEQEFSVSVEDSNVLQQIAHQIKDDIQQLNEKYQAMLEQIQSLGLNPKCFAESVKDLQNENSMLREACKMERSEKEALREKSKDMDELLTENAFMEFSLLRINDELEGLRATVKEIQELCLILQEEKSTLVDEKSTLLSQLQIITDSMQKLLEKKDLLEKSLSDAKSELEGLRTKSSDLEDLCKLLNDEKHSLQNERSMLISQLEKVEAKLSNLENKFTELEDKYVHAEKDKESASNQVEELRASMLVQKEKHANHKHSSEAQLANLENLLRVLQEEMWLGKVEFEREVDKAVNAQIEMFLLQSCIEELELRNLALLTECEKHVEASKFSDKVIYELESENLMQLIEEEFLLHEIRKFKMGIHKLCETLQIDLDGVHGNGIKQGEIPISHILDKFEFLRSSLVKSKEEEEQLLVENSVLLTSLHQHKSDGEKLESEKKIMEQELENMRKQNLMLQNDNVLLHEEMMDLRKSNHVFQEENCKMLEEKNSLLRSVLELQNALSAAEDENSVIFDEALALRNLNLVQESFLTEKFSEQNVLSEHLGNLIHLNSDLNQELGVLRKKIEVKEEQNAYLNVSTERMDKELLVVKNANCHLSHQIENSENLLKKKEEELLEMEKKLKAAETLNAEFCRHIEDLKMEQEKSSLIKENLDREILELSQTCMNHRKEIEHLNEANKNFQSQLNLWEAEAASFYFDTQMSSICGALLESKVTELTGVCKRLDDENSAKSLVIEHMTERVNLLESETGALERRLSAYIPIISSLKKDFASLEHISLLWTNKTSAVGNISQKDIVIETCLEEDSNQGFRENENALIQDGVSDLLSMQIRIRAVEEMMMKELERHVKKENLTAKVETEALTEETGYSNLEVTTTYPKSANRKMVMKLKEENSLDQNARRKGAKPKIRLLMKDIPLDHSMDDSHSKNFKREYRRTNDHEGISEAHRRGSVPIEDIITCFPSDNSGKCLSYSSELDIEKELGVDKLELSKTVKETTEDDKRKILERLASDGQKLAILKMALQDLKKKPETKKKSRLGNDIEYETVKRHIQEVEEAVIQQAGTNDQLAKDVEESISSWDKEIPMELEKCGHIHRRRVTEQARRGSEQIGRLQFEVQNIQYILLKLADESNNKGKKRFSRPTGVLLRDFIQIGRINSKRRRKGRVCGCSRPSTNED